jgi:heme-degrading monooxygenase HmoA
MYARITTLEGAPDKMDDAWRHIQEQVLPQLQQMDGFNGFLALGDRQSGKVLGVAFWESEEALRDTEVPVSKVRSEAAQAAGGTVAGVEQYEVIAYEAPSAGPVSGVTDTVGGTVSGATHSVRGVTDNLLGGDQDKQR